MSIRMKVLNYLRVNNGSNFYDQVTSEPKAQEFMDLVCEENGSTFESFSKTFNAWHTHQQEIERDYQSI